MLLMVSLCAFQPTPSLFITPKTSMNFNCYFIPGFSEIVVVSGSYRYREGNSDWEEFPTRKILLWRIVDDSLKQSEKITIIHKSIFRENTTEFTSNLGFFPTPKIQKLDKFKPLNRKWSKKMNDFILDRQSTFWSNGLKSKHVGGNQSQKGKFGHSVEELGFRKILNGAFKWWGKSCKKCRPVQRFFRIKTPQCIFYAILCLLPGRG